MTTIPENSNTVAAALNATVIILVRKQISDPERWARTLLAFVANVESRDIAALDNRILTATEQQRLKELISQTSADAPVAYLVNRAPFLDADFEVTPDTLICKPDTELFVQIVFDVLARESDFPNNAHILEVCTGSGCVAITFARQFPNARVVATDISDAALAVAARNVDRHGVASRLTLGQGSFLEPAAPLAGGRLFDLIVSNPPYIPTKDIAGMGRHVADHEPHLALDGGDDGLDPHRKILADAPPLLRPGGLIFLEHEWHQGEAGRKIAQNLTEYTAIRTISDSNGKDRALVARRV